MPSSGAMLPVPGALRPFEDVFVVGDASSEWLEVRWEPVDLLLRWAPRTARLRRRAGREREPERGPPEVGLVVDRTSVRGSAAFGKKHDPCAAHQIGDDLGDTDGSLRDLLWCSCTTVVSVSAVWSSSTSRPLAHQSGSVEVCGWLVMDGVAKSDLGPGINGSHAAESSTFQRYRAHAAAPSELAVVCQPGGRDGVLDRRRSVLTPQGGVRASSPEPPTLNRRASGVLRSGTIRTPLGRRP